MSITTLNALWKLLAAHQLAVAGAAAAVSSWAVSAYASTLVEPPPGSPRRAVFWYRFVHTAAGNLDRLRGR